MAGRSHPVVTEKSASDWKHCIFLPLISQTRPAPTKVGGIVLFGKTTWRPTSSQRQQLTVLAEAIANRIQKHWSLERWDKLVLTERRIQQARSVKEIFQIALEEPVRLLDLGAAWGFWGLDFTRRVITYVGEPRWEGSNAVETLATDATDLFVATDRDDQAWRFSMRRESQPWKSLVVVPLLGSNVPRSALVFVSTGSDRFGDSECFFLQNVGVAVLHGLTRIHGEGFHTAQAIIGASSTTLVHDVEEYARLIDAALRSVKQTMAVPSVRQVIGSAGVGLGSVVDEATSQFERVQRVVETVTTLVAETIRDPTLSSEVCSVESLVSEFLLRWTSENRLPDYISIENLLPDSTQSTGRFLARCNGKLLTLFIDGFVRNSIEAITRKAMSAPSTYVGSIRLGTKVYEGQDYGEILVIDNGEGLPDVETYKYFRPDGSGLQLPLSMNVIESLWHGQVTPLRNSDGGTTLIARLPIEVASP